MKYWSLLILSSLLFCSFQHSGNTDYWKVLRGIKNVQYKTLPSVEWTMCNFPHESTRINIERKIRTSCQFPKSAKRLHLKKIEITGWISCSLRRRKSMLVKMPFDLENMKNLPRLDEKVELNESFYEWAGKKVKVTGILKLNQEDGHRHCYLLENIEQIELAK